jgi:phosphoribosylaminoimidazole-succinocarboxamide synthase
MPSQSIIEDALAHTIDRIDFNGAAQRFSGKVRESFIFDNGAMALVVTDRVSVFDYGIGTIPFKGQVLNRLAAWWFDKLGEIDVPHHLIAAPHPNVSLVKRATPIPIEVIVRAYLTGTTTTSSWYAYQNNERRICGIEMPAGMKKNEKFPQLLVTPTTKAVVGHDANISREDILAEGLVEEAVYNLVEDYALRMFKHAAAAAAERGLILVDTKYEMGLTDEGDLIVIDEVHTPDSSRYWKADTYQARLNAGQEPDNLDKEFVRRMIVDAGYDVNSVEEPKKYFTDAMRVAAAEKYGLLFEAMTGETFHPTPVAPGSIERVLAQAAGG